MLAVMPEAVTFRIQVPDVPDAELTSSNPPGERGCLAHVDNGASG